MKRPAALWALLALGLAVSVRAQTVAPPMHPEAHDTPDDGGRSVDIRWAAAPEADPGDVVEIERVAADGTAQRVGDVPLSDGSFVDGPEATGAEGPLDGVAYHWRLTVRRGELSSAAIDTPPATASAQLFHQRARTSS
jgi:hypothetical protein